MNLVALQLPLLYSIEQQWLVGCACVLHVSLDRIRALRRREQLIVSLANSHRLVTLPQGLFFTSFLQFKNVLIMQDICSSKISVTLTRFYELESLKKQSCKLLIYQCKTSDQNQKEKAGHLTHAVHTFWALILAYGFLLTI